MIDIKLGGSDLAIKPTQLYKCINMLNTQINTLSYTKGFGIDLSLFFTGDINIQTDVFKKYCIQQLTKQGINILSLAVEDRTLDSIFNFVVGDNV